MGRIRVAVVYGGRSSEHGISVVSAGSVISALDPAKYEVVPVGITPAGAWVLTDADASTMQITGRSVPRVDEGRAVVLPADPTAKGLIAVELAAGVQALETVDVVFPVLHGRFVDPASLDEVDDQVGAWRDAVKDGSVLSSAWPAFINIPSKIGQVAAVRALAKQRREQDAARGILVAAVCPGMMNTPASAMWWDVSDAPSPAEAAVALLDLALDPVRPGHYGELVRNGDVLPWAPYSPAERSA